MIYQAVRQSGGEWLAMVMMIRDQSYLPRGTVLPTGACPPPAIEPSFTLTRCLSEEERDKASRPEQVRT